jgi:hypothetical protein
MNITVSQIVVLDTKFVVKEKQAISSSQNFFSMIDLMTLPIARLNIME